LRWLADATGKTWGIQIIRGQNRKKGELEKEFYPPGLAKKCHFHTLGVIRDTVLITEGYATGATRKLRRMVIPSAVDLEKSGMPHRISRENFASTQ